MAIIADCVCLQKRDLVDLQDDLGVLSLLKWLRLLKLKLTELMCLFD